MKNYMVHVNRMKDLFRSLSSVMHDMPIAKIFAPKEYLDYWHCMLSDEDFLEIFDVEVKSLNA